MAEIIGRKKPLYMITSTSNRETLRNIVLIDDSNTGRGENYEWYILEQIDNLNKVLMFSSLIEAQRTFIKVLGDNRQKSGKFYSPGVEEKDISLVEVGVVKQIFKSSEMNEKTEQEIIANEALSKLSEKEIKAVEAVILERDSK